MARDFFDEDLANTEIPPVRPGAASAAAEYEDDPDQAVQAGNRMARQRDEVSTQVAGAMSEIERLRLRQEALEKERQDLANLARKQEQYEQGKRDIIEKLGKSVVLLEKEEQQGRRMLELLSVIRQRFKGNLEELIGIREEAWLDEEFQDELNRALVLVDKATSDYRSGLAKIEASSWHRDLTAGRPPALDHAARELSPTRGFGFWLKAGVAFSLPMIVVMIVLYFVYLHFLGIL